MSDAAKSWAWKQMIHPTAKSVLHALADPADEDGYCFPNIGTLMAKCCLSRPTVKRMLAKLEAAPLKLLAKTPRHTTAGRQTSNLYQLQLDRYAAQDGIHIGKTIIMELPLEPQDVAGEGVILNPSTGSERTPPPVQNEPHGGFKMTPPLNESSLTGFFSSKDKNKEEEKRRAAAEAPPCLSPQVVVDRFEEFWKVYPARNGKKLERTETLRRFLLLSDADQALAVLAATHYAASQLVQDGKGTRDPKRFLCDGKNNEPWRDWLTPEVPHRPGAAALTKALSWKPPELRELAP